MGRDCTVESGWREEGLLRVVRGVRSEREGEVEDAMAIYVHRVQRLSVWWRGESKGETVSQEHADTPGRKPSRWAVFGRAKSSAHAICFGGPNPPEVDSHRKSPLYKD